MQKVSPAVVVAGLTAVVSVIALGSFLAWYRTKAFDAATTSQLVAVSVATPSPSSAPATPTSASPTPELIQEVSHARAAHILMYHYIRDGVSATADPVGYRLSVKPNELDNQIGWLAEQGYYGVTMADVAAGKGGSKAVVLTFDDGYADFYTNAYPILKKYGWKATLYVISNRTGGQYITWDQIKEVSAGGVEIGSHTLDHRELNKLSREAQERELVQSKQAIEAQLGAPVTTLAYPVGRYNEITTELARSSGYSTAVTTKPGTARISQPGDEYILPRHRITPDLNKAEFLGLLIR